MQLLAVAVRLLVPRCWRRRLLAAAVPLLVMSGEADHIVRPDNARAACDFFPSCTFAYLDPEAGFSTTYGHIDPLLGTTARAEIYPLISDFLIAH